MEEETDAITVPARTMLPATGSSVWHSCEATSYNSVDETFTVVFPSGDTETRSRLQICFDAEDPQQFVHRLVFAHAARDMAEALIRYNLYVDCMPTDGVAQLDSEQINRIVSRALNTLSLKRNEFDTNQLLSEVNTDYARTMNKIVFDANMRDPSNSALAATLNLPPSVTEPVPPAPARSLAVVETPSHDFAEQFSTYAFNTCLAHGAVVATLDNIHGECLSMLNLRGLVTTSKRAMKIDEFSSMQDHAIKTFSRRLSEWSEKIASLLKDGLAEAGKGNYDITETRRDVYKYSKLFKLLWRVNQTMEDMLRIVQTDTLTEYTSFIENVSAWDINVVSAIDVSAERDISSLAQKLGIRALTTTERVNVQPLFVYEICVDPEDTCINQKEVEERAQEIAAWKPPDDDKEAVCELEDIEPIIGQVFRYTYSLEEASNTINAAFDECLSSVTNIPQVEHQVMEGLFWSRRPNITSLAPKRRIDTGVIVEPGVEDLQERLSNAISRLDQPLTEYLRCFDDHIEFLNLNVSELIDTFRPIVKDEISVLRCPQLTALVDHHRKERNKIQSSIPSEIVELGLIVVDASAIRDELASKHTEIISKLLGLLATHIKTNGRRILNQYENMAKSLQAFPRNIEELAKLQEYCGTISGLIEEMKEPMVSLYSDFNLLETYSHQAPVLFNQRWEICQWPRRIQKIVKRTLATIEQKKQQYSLQMADEQVIFEQTLAALEAEVRGFGSYQDIRKSKDVEVHRLTLSKKLAAAKEQVQTFNSREILFQKELTDYSQFDIIMQQWEPFNLLWKTTYSWITSYDSWMNGAFGEVDGIEVETLVEELGRDILKAKKMLEKMNMQACADIGAEIGRQVDEFKPHVPFVMGLRNPGMRERHWDQLSDEIGQDIHPMNDPDFTLQAAFDMGLQKHGELVSKVGATAGKEYQIEKGLDKMVDEWKEQQLEIVPYDKAPGKTIPQQHSCLLFNNSQRN